MTPEILDVTLRDGGYVNDFAFPTEGARRIVTTLSRVGVRGVEVGYYRPFLAHDPTVPGAKCCRPEYLRAVTQGVTDADVFVMVHLDELTVDDYRPLVDYGVTGVRMVVNDPSSPLVAHHARSIRAAGLLCSINLIRMSERTLESIVAFARDAEAHGADWFCLADSNGSMFPERVEEIFLEVRRHVRTRLGFHAHDSLSLAFGNALAATRGGAVLLDASLGGLGKGAGNLATEMISAYLKACQPCAYDIAEMVSVASEVVGIWADRDLRRRSESMLSAILDLNADQIKSVVKSAEGHSRSVLAELDRRIGGSANIAREDPRDSPALHVSQFAQQQEAPSVQ
jgi:4-hydroxy 2-oxovalerate aldolase